MKITKQQRNVLKRAILKELTDRDTGLFDKTEGWARYDCINLEMVMRAVFDGVNKQTDKTLNSESSLT